MEYEKFTNLKFPTGNLDNLHNLNDARENYKIAARLGHTGAGNYLKGQGIEW